MATEPLRAMLPGQVEIDETYVGGKPRNGSGEPIKVDRGTRETPVMVLVETQR